MLWLYIVYRRPVIEVAVYRYPSWTAVAWLTHTLWPLTMWYAELILSHGFSLEHPGCTYAQKLLMSSQHQTHMTFIIGLWAQAVQLGQKQQSKTPSLSLISIDITCLLNTSFQCCKVTSQICNVQHGEPNWNRRWDTHTHCCNGSRKRTSDTDVNSAKPDYPAPEAYTLIYKSSSQHLCSTLQKYRHCHSTNKYNLANCWKQQQSTCYLLALGVFLNSISRKVACSLFFS